jgi:cyclase
MTFGNWACAAALALALTGPAGAQVAQPALQPSTPRAPLETVDVKTTDLGKRTWLLEAEGGGNMVVADGADGVILVDSHFAELHDKIKAAIAAVTPRPVRYLVVTHFHRDHTGGDEAFAREGAIVVAQEKARDRLASGTTNGLTGNVLPPAPAIAVPKQIYGDGMTLRLQDRTAELKHLTAHTDGDTYIYFPDANVLATGDIVTFARYPNIDFAYGGSIDGIIAGVDVLLKVGDENTRIVPGHGPLGTKAGVRAYRRMLVEARDRIARLKAAGNSEDEVVAARPNAESDAQLGVTAQAAGNFVRVVYRSLKR